MAGLAILVAGTLLSPPPDKQNVLGPSSRDTKMLTWWLVSASTEWNGFVQFLYQTFQQIFSGVNIIKQSIEI